MTPGPFATLMRVVRELEAARIPFTVTRYRSEGVSLQAAVPGERWEIDVLEDGTVDFERFVSGGDVAGPDELRAAVAAFAEPAAEAGA